MINVLEAQYDSSSTVKIDQTNISREPLILGGTNFKTKKVIQGNGNSIYIKSTKQAIIFNSIFMIIGLGALFFTIYHSPDNILELIFTLLRSIYVIWVGFNLYNSINGGITFDANGKVLYSTNGKININFKDIIAIQILCEKIKTRKPRRSLRIYYMSYEMNLVISDGSRINLMDHGDRNSINQDAQIISSSLDIPIRKQTKKNLDNK